MGKFLDSAGLTHLWEKIKNYADSRARYQVGRLAKSTPLIFDGKVDGDITITSGKAPAGYIILWSTTKKVFVAKGTDGKYYNQADWNQRYQYPVNDYNGTGFSLFAVDDKSNWKNGYGKGVYAFVRDASTGAKSLVQLSATYSSGSKTGKGLLQVGDNINVAEGIISVPASDADTLGVVKGGGDVTITKGVITVKDNSHNHTIDNVTGLQTALDGKLSSNAPIPENLLPSYVDDVLEFNTEEAGPLTVTNGSSSSDLGIVVFDKASGRFVFKANLGGTYFSGWNGCDTWGERDIKGVIPEKGKIYVRLDNEKTYRWSGSALVEIAKSVTIGTGSGQAFDGAKGQRAYTHSVTLKGKAVSGFNKITTNAEGHVTAATAVTKSDIENLVGNASASANGLMSTTHYTKLENVAAGATADSALSTSEIDAVCK